MMRLTCYILGVICLLVMGAALYRVSDRTRVEAHSLHRIEAKIIAAQDRRMTLQAEWSSLNDPRRLQDLAAQYLDLSYTQARQIIDMRGAMAKPIPILLPEVSP